MRNKDEFSTLGIKADILNTLTGGMTEPIVRLRKLDDAHLVSIQVPGSDMRHMAVEVNNNMLIVHHLVTVDTHEEPFHIPRIILTTPLPVGIDVEKIDAQIEKRALVVRLPFQQGTTFYRRLISIKPEED